MADKFSSEIRSKIMKSIRSTTKLEEIVCKELWNHGLRFRKNVKDLFGKPDIAIKKYKVVIFLDSCYWHYCPIHGHTPKSNLEYWVKKLERNVHRDIKVNEHYKERSWNILRIWEHQVRTDFENTIDAILAFVEEAKRDSRYGSPH